MPKTWYSIWLAVVPALAMVGGCKQAEDSQSAATFTSAADFAPQKHCAPVSATPVHIKAGTFAMGQDAIYAEEGPIRQTHVNAFWIDPHEVTNGQFARFVDQTGYVTVAQKPVDAALFGIPAEQIPPDMLKPGSAVFTPPAAPSNNYVDWWQYLPGANWRKPYGPHGPDARDNEPVVHLAWEDIIAYAAWRGGQIPTEAEWEYAASGGAPKYTEQPAPDAANSWQGAFPVQNDATDGFKGIAPVGCFTPNGFGLYDMVGNAWEMTADYYAPAHDPADTDNPRGPSENSTYDAVNPELISRVIKGGSYLCAPNYCQRYRPEARQARDPGLGASNVGFRLVYDRPPRD